MNPAACGIYPSPRRTRRLFVAASFPAPCRRYPCLSSNYPPNPRVGRSKMVVSELAALDWSTLWHAPILGKVRGRSTGALFLEGYRRRSPPGHESKTVGYGVGWQRYHHIGVDGWSRLNRDPQLAYHTSFIPKSSLGLLIKRNPNSHSSFTKFLKKKSDFFDFFDFLEQKFTQNKLQWKFLRSIFSITASFPIVYHHLPPSAPNTWL